MLEERREYIRQEKMKRKSLTSDMGCSLSVESQQRSKTAHNRVSFAVGTSTKETEFTNEDSQKVSCSKMYDLQESSNAATKCMGTNTNDLEEFSSDESKNRIKAEYNYVNIDLPISFTKSSGTSTDHLYEITLDNCSGAASNLCIGNKFHNKNDPTIYRCRINL